MRDIPETLLNRGASGKKANAYRLDSEAYKR